MNDSPHLIYVTLVGPWFHINGDKSLRFKTRGNDTQDLFDALIKYEVDYSQADFDLVVQDMARQRWAQARKRQEVPKQLHVFRKAVIG